MAGYELGYSGEENVPLLAVNTPPHPPVSFDDEVLVVATIVVEVRGSYLVDTVV